MINSENVPPYQPGQVLHTGSTRITGTAITEVRRLLELVADTCDAAGQIAGRTGPAPIDSELDRLREVTTRIDAMVDRIRAILI